MTLNKGAECRIIEVTAVQKCTKWHVQQFPICLTLTCISLENEGVVKTNQGAGHQHHIHLLEPSFWNAAWITVTPNNPQLAYHGHAKYLGNATTQRIAAIETEHCNS